MGRVPTISLVRPTPCRDAVLPRGEAPSGASRRPCCRPATATATLLATAQRAAAAVAAARSASPSFARFYDLCSDVVRIIDMNNL